METNIGILFQDSISLHTNFKILGWRLCVLLKLESIILDSENIIDQCQVGPTMIQGGIQVILPHKWDKERLSTLHRNFRVNL